MNGAKKKKHWVLRAIIWLLLIFCVGFTILSFISSSPEVGSFKTLEGKLEYERYYYKVMSDMPVGYLTHNIETSYGIARVYEWSNSDSEIPVILLPGHSSGSPMWVENLPGFMEQHRVYTLDALGDAGKSIQTIPFSNIKEVSDYIVEVMDSVNISSAHIVGHSFGGGNAASLALNYPERVRTLTLLEPAFALNYPPVETMFWATVSSINVLPKSWRDVGLAKISGEDPREIASEDPLAKMIAVASSNYSAELPSPKVLSKSELQGLTMPVYVALAESSAITGDKAFENANIIPNAKVRIWSNTTHSLPMEVSENLAEDLNEFWKLNE